jgi:hypothetical protein
MRQVVCLVILTCLCALSLVFAGPPPTQPKSSEVLANWKNAKLITLDMADVPFKDIVKEIERQSGVRMTVHRGDEKTTLKLLNALFWKAVAEASIAAKLPFGSDIPEPSVKFTNLFYSPVFERYQIIGPFHIGMYWSLDKWSSKEKPLPAILIEAHALETQGEPGQRGIRNVVLDVPGGRRFPLQRISVYGQDGPGITHWAIPPELIGKKVDLRGEMECQVYLNPQPVAAPVNVGQKADFKHFGGIKVIVTKIEYEGEEGHVEYTVEWDHGLKGDDAKQWEGILQLEKDVMEGKRQPLSDAEMDKLLEWVFAKSEQMRTLHVVDRQLFDKDDKLIPTPSYSFWQSDSIRGDIRFEKGPQPAEMRLSLAEKKNVKAAFEFKNVFGK